MKFDLGAPDDIAEGAAKGYELGAGDSKHSFFIVRRGGRYFGYANFCPHANTPLDIWSDRFLTRDGDEILCFTHGAQFDIENGVCVSGPCYGKRLIPVSITVADGRLVFDDGGQPPVISAL